MLLADNNSYYWVIREKNTERLVGLVSLDSYHDGIHMQISYQLFPEYWNKGYATEIISVILHYSIEELNLNKVMAETQTANLASCRLLEKVGMKRVRKITRFNDEQAVYSLKLRT